MSHTPYYPTGGVPRFDMGASPVPSTPGLARPLPSSIRQTRGVRPPKPASPPPGAKSPPQQLKSGARPKKKSGKITGVTVTIGGKRVDDEEGRAPHEEAQFILRFPDDIPGLEKFRKAVDDGNPPEDFRIRFHSDRWATVTLDGQDYRAMLKDLPTVNESWKSFDRVQWWKIADVHQMLVVEGPEPPRAAEMAEPTKEEYTMNDGLTPPLKNVTNRRFRKAQLKQQIESVEKEVARLLNRDKQAFEVTTQWRLAPSNVVNNDHDQGTEAGSGGDSGSEEFDEDALAKDLERGVADNSYGQGYGYGDDDDEEEEGSEEDEAATRQAALNERQTRLESELNELRGKIAEKEAQTRSNNEWTKNTAQQQLASLRRDYNEKIKMLHETQRQLRTMR